MDYTDFGPHDFGRTHIHPVGRGKPTNVGDQTNHHDRRTARLLDYR